jgi:hypothetical protein
MLVPGSANPLLLRSAAAAATGISRSLRFNSSDSAFLSRTPASAGNRKTWSFAAWVKLGTNFSSRRMIFGGGSTANSIPNTYIEITDSAELGFDVFDGTNVVARVRTSALLRDPSAWYHIVCAVDTSQATASNRVKVYINGVQQTAFSTATYPSQDYQTGINTTQVQTLGRYPESSLATLYFDGLLADVHLIDSQALTPSSFTETDATTGQLIPKAYTGSYGTNGFRLTFADNSAATATTLGKDAAGSNNWTPNNLSVTAGAGNDSLVDVPTNGSQTDTGVGGEVRGNYCTINPLNNGGVTLVNGNLDWTRSAAGSTAVAYSTIAVSSGKWYFETTMNGAGSGVNWECGVATTTTANNIRPGTTATGWGLVTSSTTIIYKQNSNSLTSIFSGTLSTGDVIGVAFDLDNGRIWFARNGTWLEGSPSAGTGASYTNLSGTVSAFFGGDGTAVNGAANFGARSFAYTAPSGFKALCTANLPAPLVTKPNTVMDVALYTGNNTARSITGLGFSPDFVWIKGRSGATDHALYDIVRGVQKDLVSNSTAAETTQSTGLTAFNSDGFSIGTLAKLNTNAATYAAWAWDAGTTTTTNTVGSITSSVRANATAGFSVITATTTNTSSQTFGHGLGVAPVFHIIKLRNGTDDWYVYHSSIGATQYLKLNATTAATTSSALYANTAPTSSVITLGSGWNSTSYNIVCYAFAPVAGYSAFGSYTGNGSSTDGPFVYTGFRPRWVMVKRTDAARDWFVYDAVRNTYNIVNFFLRPNLADAEGTGTLYSFDFLSNGFKLRSSETDINASGGTYIYAAFAESPFNYARAR